MTRLAVSSTASLTEAVLDAVDDPSRDRLPTGARVTPNSDDGWCAGLIALVRGEVDGFLADRFRSWGHVPWVLLVEEAGGRFTPADPTARVGEGGGLYSNAALHDELRGAVSWRRGR